MSPLPNPIARSAPPTHSNPDRRRAVVVHGILPGRLRIHLSGWQPADRATLERRLRLVPGVRTVRATPATGNILFLFDPGITSTAQLLSATESALGQETIQAPATGQAAPVERPRVAPRRPAMTAKSARHTAAPLARKLLVHLPALLGLVLSLLGCSTPLGYARFGLEALQVAMQFGATSA